MTQTLSLDRAIDAPPSLPPVARAAVGDDTAMLRAAVDAGRDLIAPDARIYWFDLTASVIVGYGALALAIALSGGGALLAGVVAILALYRAGSFIHELTHFKRAHLPGFWLGWNALVGVPLLVPSFLYEGVHTLHHARTRYGTVDDPEYLPLASMKPWSLPMFVVAALFAPIALLLRFAVVAPLSALSPALRGAVVARFSALAINPAFRRRAPEGEAAREWVALEAAASVWAIALLTLVATGIVPLRAFAIFLAVAAGVALLNQVRTLVAHLWDNHDGQAMTVTAQYLDTVNVPPPALLPFLWAPVGLRYHALHHLIPSHPYHALGTAHRRLSAALSPDSVYHRASYPGLPGLVARLIGSTMGHGAKPGATPRS